MEFKYKKLGELIELSEEKNKDLTVTNLVGMNINKEFIPSIANTIGTNLANYKLVNKNQFACNLMHIGRDEAIVVSLYLEDSPSIISPAYKIFQIKNSNIIKPEFLMLYFIRPAFDKLCWFYTDSSIRGSLDWSQFCEIEVPIPHLEIQKKIINIYEFLNKRIELKNNINKNLHRLSRILLKYHLEDFKPYLDNGVKSSEIGDIPKDWKVYEFDSIANIYNGYSYKGNELQPSKSAMVTIKNFNIDGSFRTDGFKEIIYSDKIKEHHFVNENDVLISCTDVTQDANIIGNCIIVLDKMKYENLIMSMDLVKIESKNNEINNYLLASILKSYRFKMHILGYVNGTTVLHLDKKGIKKFKLALPNNLSILNNLNQIMENIYAKIAVNQKEINNLQSLRDTLLPKLMTGEIDFSKIKCDLEI